jgi:hypothetical protein
MLSEQRFYRIPERDVYRFGTFAGRRVVRKCARPELQEEKNVAAKSFRGAIGQMKNLANNKQCFNSGVAINEWAAAAIIVIRMIPRRQNVVAEPERNITAIH